MDLRTQHRALVMIRRISDYKRCTVPCIPTLPQKPACRPDAPLLQLFPRSTPEAQGISSAHIAGFLEELKNDNTLDPHSIMILRNGTVIAEGAFGAYDLRLWHITHSECKSITALAIGMLIDEEKLSLEDSVVKIFEKSAPILSLLTHKNLTVRHLLTMTSGIVFNEAGAVTETDWVRSFFESVMIPEPGKLFAYNSMNTYMLSAIVRQISGQGLMEYLQERLWEPLGITEIFWETCPKGIEKGGWGLYIRPEDIAKIGQLILHQGKWKGRQLISESFLSQAITSKMKTSKNLGDYNYGYQIWVGREQNVFLFNGMFSQNVIGFPDTGLLIVSNAGNDELFQQSHFFALVDRYFSKDFHPETVLPENPEASKHLLLLEADLCKPIPFETLPSKPDKTKLLRLPDGQLAGLPKLKTTLSGRTYLADEAESRSVSLLPLMTQAIQNNYGKGLKSLVFDLSDEEFTLVINESGESYRLPIGFDAPKRTDLSFHGEPYRVGVEGRFFTDEEGHLALDIRISFLEIANTRLLKISFFGGGIVVKWLELPGKTYLSNAMDAIMNEVKLYPFLQTVLSTMDNDFLWDRIRKILEPEITCRLQKPE